MRSDIDEVLNFLKQYAAEDLAALQQHFVDEADSLLPNHHALTDPSLLVQAQATRAALHRLSAVALLGTAGALGTLRESEQLEDWATGVTAASAALTAAFSVYSDRIDFRIGAAAMTLVASVAAVFAKQRKRAAFSKDVSEHAKTLAGAVTTADSLSIEMDSYLDQTDLTPYDEKVRQVLEKSNALFRTANLALLDLGFGVVRA